MDSWDSWIQSVGSTVVDKWSTAQWQQPYEIDRLKMEQQGMLGRYQEGQAGIRANRNGLTISPMLLLIGAAFFLMKD